MDTTNQQSINVKISALTENMNLLLENTMTGSMIYIMTEKMSFMKLTETQYHSLLFERDLFDILLKNKFAIQKFANADRAANKKSKKKQQQDDEEYEENVQTTTTTNGENINLEYANTDYPFSLLICSGEANRSSIYVSNVGLVLIKFVLYLRMLNQILGRADCPNCQLALNMKLLPLRRICLDIDYKPSIDPAELMSDEDYDNFVEQVFKIVCSLTTTGAIIMTQNCFTPNTRSFHLITEQQFDTSTYYVIFFKICEKINELSPYFKVDPVDNWMLPYGRGHVPVRKFIRKTTEFVSLQFPYTEIDFELTMPIDLTIGMDNLHTLLTYTISVDGDDEEDDAEDNLNLQDFEVVPANMKKNHLVEYLDNEEKHRYFLRKIDDIPGRLQPFMKVSTLKYDFGFQCQYLRRYYHNFIPRVLGNKYNTFFLIMSNKKLLFENNWRIPKPKIRQRPVEFYEIYRFITDELVGVENMEKLFDLLPNTLARRNVSIGNVDDILNATKTSSMMVGSSNKVSATYNGTITFNFGHCPIQAINSMNINEYLAPAISTHPWPYLTDNLIGITSIASSHTKQVYEFFNKTLANNTYSYEKNKNAIVYFTNIQSALSQNKDFVEIINTLCDTIYHAGPFNQQKYIMILYEFFCRVHYIDSCLTTDEWEHLRASELNEAPTIREQTIENYRRKYVEMAPGARAYKQFPVPKSALHDIWRGQIPRNKIILHTIYLMMVEHNYTSVFIYLHNILGTTDVSFFVTSLMLNIIDNTYIDGETHQTVKSYAAREFLNFIYCTFIDAGINVSCLFENLNVRFNTVNLNPIITDIQTMFIASPFWFFLGNFQYVNEHMDFSSRYDLFVQIFRNDDPNAPSQAEEDEIMMMLPGPSNKRKRGGGGSGGRSKKKFALQQVAGAPNTKSPMGTFNTDQYFEMYSVEKVFWDDLNAIFFNNIGCVCAAANGTSVYDGCRFNTTMVNIMHIPLTIMDPVKYAMIYRHQFGIYNTWTMQYERNTSCLYTPITIGNEEFSKYPDIFNAYNERVYKVLINRFLKSITFTRLLNMQKTLGLLLAPIYDPNMENPSSRGSNPLNYNIDSVQININDLSSMEYIITDGMLWNVIEQNNKLYEMFKWLYSIICHYSENFSCNITNPGSFIPKPMVPEITVTTSRQNASKKDSYSMFQQQLAENNFNHDMDVDKGETLIQRLHKIMDAKKSDQQRNITDELHRLSIHEMTSLITLFDNIVKHDEISTKKTTPTNEDVPETPLSQSSSSSSLTNVTVTPDLSSSSSSTSSSATPQTTSNYDDLTKFNLSTRGGNKTDNNALVFYRNDDYLENSRNKILLNLFNRKMGLELTDTSLEEFRHIIEENFGTHIIRFVLLSLSWFIRTKHVHLLSETLFFRELEQHRQLLYNELSELVFRHNGYFIYNNSIVDVVDVFSHYCKQTKLNVDPAFEMSFSLASADLYLDYDEELERKISPDLIRDIEAGCVSAIYQGQFIENTNVDLLRCWSRCTIPRNKHRISPLFTLHTATGKSEYLAEKCRKHFHNIYYNNFLDSTSLKSGDHRGIDMAPELNANLIMCIEEFTNLGEKFKQICNHSTVTYKKLFTNSKSSFQNNATLVLATNNDPKCNEEAVIARLHVFPRHIQYENVNKYAKFQRATICSDAKLKGINNIFTVQLIMDKMPRVVAENYRGNFMMTWLLKRFFLYNIVDPVTVQASETLQGHIDKFHTMIDARQIILDRIEMNTGEMSLMNFRRFINSVIEENRSLFNTRIDTYNIYSLLTADLKSVIDEKENKIYVRVKPLEIM